MRPMLPLLLLLAPAAASAQAPVPPPIPQIPGVSAAGMAALNKLRTKQDPAVPPQLQAEAAVQQEMKGVLDAPALDVDKLAAAMAHRRAVAANGSKIGDEHVLVMLRALPAGDRKAFVRALLPRQGAPAGPAR